MYHRFFRFIILFLVLCILPLPAIAEENPLVDESSEAIPAREKDFEWVLGVCKPSIVGSLDPSLALLVEGYMDRFLELLADAGGEIGRSLSELTGIESDRIREGVGERERSLVAQIGERDQLLFKGYSAWKYRSLLEKAILSIEEQQRLLEIERSRTYLVPERAQFRVHATNAKGELLPTVNEDDASVFSKQNELDAILITGIREHYGYLVFSWKLFLRWEDAVVMEDEALFSRHSRDEAAEDTACHLLSRLTGRPLSRVAIRDLPLNSHLEIDGRIVKQDETLLLSAGKHRLTVDSEGYHSLAVSFTLKGGEALLMRPRMKTLEVVETKIEVFGPETDDEQEYEELENVAVLLNNRYQGKTPLSIPLPVGETFVLGLSLPGYESRTIIYESDGSAHVRFTLPVFQEGRAGVNETRKSFYRAFGWFFLSVPLAMIATGIHQSYSEALTRTANPVYSTGTLVSLVSMGALWTGSAVLLGNTAWHLVQYLKASDDIGVDDQGKRGE